MNKIDNIEIMLIAICNKLEISREELIQIWNKEYKNE